MSHSSSLTVIALLIGVVIMTSMSGTGATPVPDYLAKRKGLMSQDSKLRLGANLVLSPDEQVVNNIVMSEKKKMMDEARGKHSLYTPSLSFAKAKPLINKTPLYKIIQRMPKGAALHLHDLSIASLDWVVKNVTYRDHVHMCVDKDSFLIFHVFKNPPKSSDCKWESVKEARAAFGDVEEFDMLLKRNLSFLATDPLTTFADNDEAWVRFEKHFAQVYNLLFYIPIMRDYYRHALEEFYQDNVQYIEVRAQLAGLYDLEGRQYDAEYSLNEYIEITEQFIKDHPDASGAKFIMSGLRAQSKSEIFEQVKTAMKLHQKYPAYMLGYDLVGDEVWYNPLIYYLDSFLYPSKQNPPLRLPYFFHAGETEWQGTEVDDNLFDAVLLNTTRIGHGYALSKHPKLVEIVRERQIAVELNPVSNQLLRLVTDLRNHPMTSLMTDDFPVVVSSDDPAAWEASPLSHDFFMAFMDMSGENADLTFLKQLAINSIKFSGMSSNEKDAAMKLWKAKWHKFIKEILKEHRGKFTVV